ncbi:MAG: thiamine-binding protein [Actinobacteria bacterium]|nr:thiamine-binding protein [Actinomycetota bacterium]
MPRATLAIQVLPLRALDALAAVNAAIAVVQASGVRHEVGPMETTLEGENAAELLDVAARAHAAPLSAGAEAVQSNIRLLEQPAGLMSTQAKVAPFRAKVAS